MSMDKKPYSLKSVFCTGHRLKDITSEVRSKIEKVDRILAENLPGDGYVVLLEKNGFILSVWIFGFITDTQWTLLCGAVNPNYDTKSVEDLVFSYLKGRKDLDWDTILMSEDVTISNPNGITIKRVSCGDAGFVPFIVTAWKYLLDHKLCDASVIILGSDTNAFMAFRSDGTPVGVITWDTSYNKTFYIGIGYVDPNYRKRGIYNRLVERLKDHAKENGVTKITGWIKASNGPMVTAAARQGRTITSLIKADIDL